jgi:hypothetical protein
VLLLYHDRRAYCLRAPIAQHRRLFRRGLLPWPPPEETAEQEGRPHLEVVVGAAREEAAQAPQALS